MSVLVTGGTGYIGSHTVVELLENGEDVIVVDNLSNSEIEVVDKIKKITNKDFKFYEVDILDREKLEKVFDENKQIDTVIHFAGYKAVGESVEKPLMYYMNNITGTLVLLEVMKEHNVKNIIFSSSATVYGDAKVIPIKEDSPRSATNPYGQTKLMIEQILEDLCVSDSEWSAILLRYFNPIGAHESGLIGENPKGIPNNLMPYIVKVANRELEELKVFGDDYDTKDGTGVRDYIHVVDLAKGHVSALNKIRDIKGINAYNLGTGTGYSVLEVVKTFENVTGQEVKYEIIERRPGDIATCYADPTKAFKELGWKATLNIDDMCRSSWEYVQNKSKEKNK